jgi:hypothetical protein
VLPAGVVGERTAVEAAELVVEDAGEGQVQRRRARRRDAVERDASLLEVFVVAHRALEAAALVVEKFGGEDLEFGGVEHDLAHRLVDHQAHVLLAGEGRAGEIRRQREFVALRLNRFRQPMRSRGHASPRYFRPS